MTHLKQLKIRINAAIIDMAHVPVIDAENVAQHVLRSWPQDMPRPFRLKDPEELAAEILRERFAPIARLKRGRDTTGLIDQYFAVLEKVGADDFWHPELEGLRQRMSEAERLAVRVRLQEEGEAAAKEAEALEEFGRRKGFIRRANDNSPS